MVYDKVLVNEGNAWKPDSNTVVIPYTGYYLVHYGDGNPDGPTVSYYLYSSGEKVTRLLRRSRNQSGIDCVGKTVIVRFEAGSVLKISSMSNTYSSDLMQTTFMGFLIQEG